MKQVNHAHQEAYQELLTVAKWTVLMLDQNAITYGGNIVNPTGVDEFCNWAAAVRAAVAKAEIVQDSSQQIKRTHANVRLPEFKQNEVVTSPFDNPDFKPTTASAIWTKETLGEDY